MKLIKQLKKHNKTLYEIHCFMLEAEKLNYGEVEFVIKTHNYVARMIEMKAVKPKKKTMIRSVTKKIIVKEKRGEGEK